jgi:SAM-dependent MidA family methyltransferase
VGYLLSNVDEVSRQPRDDRRKVTYGAFVDRALFAANGYYASGRVRFGEGGHFETFPTALSPVFGRLVAERAWRLWRRAGEPARFEIYEVGAGDGQLALDVLCHLAIKAAAGGARARFARAARYVIAERSAALRLRQQQRLRGLPRIVRATWVDTALARPGAVRRARASAGLVIANEVVDCLPHERVVVPARGAPRATLVAMGATRAVPRTVPLRHVRGLEQFLRNYRPEILAPGKAVARPGVYFACPLIVPFIDNLARLYRRSEIWLVDYGGGRRFQLRAAERRKVWVGVPHRGRPPHPARVFHAPGTEDITFLVDFDVIVQAARRAGLRVAHFGAQGALARRAGVRLGAGARREIVRHRVLRWCLAATSDGGALGAVGFGNGRTTLAADVARSLRQWKGELPTPFRAVVLVTADGESRAGKRRRRRPARR